jgi:hypothetical protein
MAQIRELIGGECKAPSTGMVIPLLRIGPLQGAFRLASLNRSAYGQHVVRNPRLTTAIAFKRLADTEVLAETDH